jgi:hypothetical protein
MHHSGPELPKIAADTLLESAVARELALSHRSLVILISIVLSACGGGGDSAATSPPPGGGSASDAARISAATATANSSTNACAPIQPFYWEIGDRSAAMASGSVGGASPTASTPMSIASASKWLYSSYVVQRRGSSAGLTAADIKFLNFRSGYTNFDTVDGCPNTGTIDACLAYKNNGVYSAATDGKFDYDGGHMEKHAAQEMGLGALNNATLAAELQSQIGNFGFIYTQPQLAGGVFTDAASYAGFLRKMLSGALAMNAALGSHAVCTNPLTCGDAKFAPLPSNESWHYSIGHWVEDDPLVGDGAFSSPGAFGFYPWIDSTRSYYGIVARTVPQGAFTSVQCGRLIRKAWLTAAPQ